MKNLHDASPLTNDTIPPDVSVIVVNYNGRAHLDRCLSAMVRQDTAHELVVVDNGSDDGSLDLVRERYPMVRTLSLGRNVGFAAANNAGARAAKGRYLAFLNNDTEPDPKWLGVLRSGLDAGGGAGFATSRIVYMDARSVIDSAGDVLTRWGGAFKRGHGGPVAAVLEPREVFGACGAACLFRREVFEAVGGFDEDFFLVFEDVDLSYRAQLLGYRCFYVPDAVVAHAGSATLGRVNRTTVFYGQRNLEWLYVKNTPGPLLVATLPGHLVYVVAAATYYAAVGLLSPFISGKWAALRGLGGALRKRRSIQRRRRVSSRDVWRLLDRRWLVHKLREKRFDLGLARSV